MKKMVIILLIAVIFCGCSKQKEENEQKQIPQPPQTEQPKQQSAPKNEMLAAFKTVIHDNAENRLHNINLSVSAIDGTTLAPGDVFSFNAIVGERTPERGYRKAKVLIKGEYVEDYGGGVCQVSTTIYNAALTAGLEIIEHHTHDKPVNYVKAGKDAAVNYGSLDLKIKNNTQNNIILAVSTNNSEIYASISKIV